MRFRQTHFFNMVEVALALLVISLGLSTVLTLFPAGLKATREAEAANDLAEAAEYVFGYLQAIAQNSSIHVVSNPVAGAVTAAPANTNRLTWESSPGVYLYRKTTSLSSGYADDFSCIVQVFNAQSGTKSEPDGNGVGPLAYFPSPVATASDQITEVGTRGTRNTYGFVRQGSSTSGVFHAYDVELSYPVYLPRENRTIRTYRMVILDD